MYNFEVHCYYTHTVRYYEIPIVLFERLEIKLTSASQIECQTVTGRNKREKQAAIMFKSDSKIYLSRSTNVFLVHILFIHLIYFSSYFSFS